jgi:hypothetical protein
MILIKLIETCSGRLILSYLFLNRTGQGYAQKCKIRIIILFANNKKVIDNEAFGGDNLSVVKETF